MVCPILATVMLGCALSFGGRADCSFSVRTDSKHPCAIMPEKKSASVPQSQSFFLFTEIAVVGGDNLLCLLRVKPKCPQKDDVVFGGYIVQQVVDVPSRIN